MQIGLAALSEDEIRRYRTLAVYPEDVPVPIPSLELLWPNLFEATAESTRAVLETIAGRDLLIVDRETVSFHDLQREYLLLETDSVALLHADLLAAYRALLDEPTGSWSKTPSA